ncbi:unnamed protein product [Brachionus calyciflorus]|uniref:G-protein coupled receptors family 1 profile domain-containing protein n=1 Tax=Brachionus calyciflorus TaxID=104777 RepID=A0A813TBB8_9BILA|nr:unnamed protein product [Brachionus calyciflorus]
MLGDLTNFSDYLIVSSNSTLREYETSIYMFIILSLLYGCISLISVFGNLLILCVVIRNKKMHTVTNYFICNLAMADLVIGLFATPFQFQTAYLQRWIFPNILCKMAPFAATLSSNVNIITLVAISLDRHHVILHPLKKKLSKKKCILILILIWIVSIMSITRFFNYKVFHIENKKQCNPINFELLKYDIIILTGLQFIIPFVIISITYIKIANHIYFAETPQTANCNQIKTRKKVIKMILIVVVLFMICWAPIHLFNVINVLFPDTVGSYNNIHIIWFFSNSLAASNSCYNVFIYGLCSERYKSEFKKMLKCLPCIDDDKNREVIMEFRRLYYKNNGQIKQNQYSAFD